MQDSKVHPTAKLIFAIKTSLSLTIAYLLPFVFEWQQASTSAMTVMLIATIAGTRDSIRRGLIRVSATVVGAAIGLMLIALFPQERFAYLMSLSLFYLLFSYLYFAYRGDKTFFLLVSMTMMMMFTSGGEYAFLYGVERTYMTIFGIVVFTVVDLFGFWVFRSLQTHSIVTAPPADKIGFRFAWFDPEAIKGALQLYFIFWFSVAFWIYFNPPGGFFLVVLACVMGYLTTFSIIRPITMITLYSIGFAIALGSYIFILPYLHYWWELALFLLIYSFLGFYLVHEKLIIFFLMGLFLFNINNPMVYSLELVLGLMFMFYLFLTILMLLNNFPFSSKPEHLFRIAKERFMHYAQEFDKLKNTSSMRRSFLRKMLILNVEKMELWSKYIDYNYFNLDKNGVESFVQECRQYLNGGDLQLCYNSESTIEWQSLREVRF